MSLPRLQRGDAAACSGPVRGSRVSGTPAAPLRIFPLTLRFGDSFISVRAAAARSVRAGSVHPAPYSLVSPSTRRCVRICVWEGQTHHFGSADLTTLPLIGESSPGDHHCVQPSLVSLAAGVYLFVCFYVRREQCNNKPVV